MALYHLSVKPVARGAGRSAPAAAAYRSGSQVLDRASAEWHDYTRKRGVVHTEIVLPARAAPGCAWARDRTELWNAAEAAERRRDARVAREVEVALPHELPAPERVALARALAAEIAERQGCAVDVAVHAPHRAGDARNHHAHLLATTREVTPTGLAAKCPIEWDERRRAAHGLAPARQEITQWRARWAEITNARLAAQGLAARIDARSLAAQGIDRVPGSHLGPAVVALARRGVATEVGERVRAEREREASARLAQAAELGRIARERAALERAILDVSGDLARALAERARAERTVALTPPGAGAVSVSAAERFRAQVDARAQAILEAAAREREAREAREQGAVLAAAHRAAEAQRLVEPGRRPARHAAPERRPEAPDREAARTPPGPVIAPPERWPAWTREPELQPEREPQRSRGLSR